MEGAINSHATSGGTSFEKKILILIYTFYNRELWYWCLKAIWDTGPEYMSKENKIWLGIINLWVAM